MSGTESDTTAIGTTQKVGLWQSHRERGAILRAAIGIGLYAAAFGASFAAVSSARG